jgi:hypothetical protein
LGEAKYPVIVDPTVGTTTLGSRTTYLDTDVNKYVTLFIETSIAVNRFVLPERLPASSTLTATVYASNSSSHGQCKPVIYTENVNGPRILRSNATEDIDIAITPIKVATWRNKTFKTINTTMNADYPIWFGLFCEYFAPRFDYGAKCYKDHYDLQGGNTIPSTYPLWSTDNYYDFKLSMYFTYSNAQNYVRTLTQGVRIQDNRVISCDYERITAQTVQAYTLTERIYLHYRKIQEAVQGIANIFTPAKNYVRTILQVIAINERQDILCGFKRKSTETVKAHANAEWLNTICRKISETVQGIANNFISHVLVRLIHESAKITDALFQKNVLLRKLIDKANTKGEARNGLILLIKLTETVYTAGLVFRKLFVIVRIVTGVFVRDFLFGRFLKSRQELVIKSVITREINLDSKLG